jgi:hypothetical protein
MAKNTITNLPKHLINIRDIDLRPGPFGMSFHFDLFALARSIKEVGLINTPLLRKNDDGTLNIVLGFRRIKAFQSLGREEVPCRIVPESHMAPVDLLLLSLNDNLATRSFNDVEKAMVISRLSRWLQKNDIVENYMPLLKLSAQESTRAFYCRIEDELNEHIKTSIINGGFSLHAVKLILQMDDEAKHVIFKLMTDLTFNFNQQKQLIDYLDDLKYIKDCSVSDILEIKSISNIRTHSRLNIPQKVNALLRELRSMIYPKLMDAEQSFKRMVSALDLPQGIKISAPPFFEAPHYRMEIEFETGEELSEKIEQLKKERGLDELYQPWEKD